ncbi:hypothetical protein J6590_062526 [Homalodisca vitripennis]|nr:hypothetical protein J6590_062526 [Homalodisca vitripennis]
MTFVVTMSSVATLYQVNLEFCTKTLIYLGYIVFDDGACHHSMDVAERRRLMGNHDVKEKIEE